MTFLQEPPPGRKCNATVINSPEKKYTGPGGFFYALRHV